MTQEDLTSVLDDDAKALRSRPQPLAAETATAALREHYGIDGSVAALRGERDTNMLVSVGGEPRYVLRVANPAERRIVAAFRAAELLHIERTSPSLPAPRLQRTKSGAHQFELTDVSGVRVAQLVTYLPGAPMTGAGGTAPDYRQLGDVAARVSLALAGFDHPGGRVPLLWDIAQLPQAARLAGHVTDREQARLVAWAIDGFRSAEATIATLRRQVIHNDLNPHNIMVSPENELTGIIDFGDSVHSTLANDAAVACSYILEDTEDPLAPVRALLSAYCAVLPLTGPELSLLPQLIAARHALTILITSWRAALYPDNASYILRNQPASVRGLRLLHGIGIKQAREQILAATRGSSA